MSLTTFRIPQAAIDAAFAFVLPRRDDRYELQGLFNRSTGEGTYRHVRMSAAQAASLSHDAREIAGRHDLDLEARCSLEHFAEALRRTV